MKIKTIQKLISSVKKELENLLVTKSILEEKIIRLNGDLDQLKKNLQDELAIAMQQIIWGFNQGEFITNELEKQRVKQLEISDVNSEIGELLQLIVSKNINKKIYEHILEQRMNENNIREAKDELQLNDAYAILSFNKQYED